MTNFLINLAFCLIIVGVAIWIGLKERKLALVN